MHMMLPPCDEFLFPLSEFGGWHRVAEPKRDELHNYALLPMRQERPVLKDLTRFIQEICHV